MSHVGSNSAVGFTKKKSFPKRSWTSSMYVRQVYFPCDDSNASLFLCLSCPIFIGFLLQFPLCQVRDKIFLLVVLFSFFWIIYTEHHMFTQQTYHQRFLPRRPVNILVYIIYYQQMKIECSSLIHDYLFN